MNQEMNLNIYIYIYIYIYDDADDADDIRFIKHYNSNHVDPFARAGR